MIDKPVPGVTTDARPHPGGAKGAKLSLKEVSERAWKARMSPRLRAWVTQQLDKCGCSTGGRRQKAKCILDAFRLKVPYVHDPLMGEFMATPDQLLCLDEGGLCIIGGDCDEASITLAAACMCIGIPTVIIGASYRDPTDVPTHVFMGFKDDLGDWVKMDGTTKLPMGRVSPNMREWWYDPSADAKELGSGDFVGMSGDPRASAGVVGVSGPSVHTLNRLELTFPGIR
jgi:hypothetical protein